MTVSSTTTRNSYSGDGSTTVFAYTFKIFDEADISVILRAADGTETVQTLTTNYTLSGVGNTSGGNVTFVTAPTSTQTVVLLRATARTQATDYTPNDPFPAASHEDALDKLTFIAQEIEEELGRAIKVSKTNTITSTEFTIGASDRANKIFAFDSDGDFAVTQEIGTYRGTDATTTTAAYKERDLIKSTTAAQLDNVYICVADSVIGDLLTDTDHFELIIDAVTAATSVTSAAASATAAANSATAAATSESNAATSESNAATSESNASTSETNAATSETNASNSASAAATSATNAATSATSASTSATTATTKASEASTSASNAATSESNASTSETNAATSATTATTKAAEASTSATNAATSESNASTSATAAAASAASAAASFDAFDDIYLGAKASAPTVDNDGDALTTGDQYFNTTNNTLFVWNGSAWQAASPDIVGDTTPQLGGNLDLNSNDITGTGDINITGTITAEASGANNSYITATGTGGSANLNLKGADDGFSSVFFRDTTGIRGRLQYDHTNETLRMDTNATQRFLIDSDGDISFYDSTGVTQGFFWDASTQRLGLGTTSPSKELHVKGDVDLEGDTGGVAVLRFKAEEIHGTVEGINIGVNYGGLAFKTNNNGTTAERMRIDNAGNVGIGKTPTSKMLEIYKGSNPGIRIQNSTTGTTNSDGFLLEQNGSNTLLVNYESGYQAFYTGGSEQMRLDSSGNALVGKTSPNSTVQGVELSPNGYGIFTPSNNHALLLNRKTSDGAVVTIRKDGTNVGVIGTQNWGIGTSSPSSTLEVAASEPTIRLKDSDNNYYAELRNNNGNLELRADHGNGNAGSVMTFTVDNSEKMRLDSSGNLLVGTTSPVTVLRASTTEEGIALQPNGQFAMSHSQATAGVALGYLNRRSSDGQFLQFRKDGLSVGAIGTHVGDLIVGNGDTTLKFYAAGDAILPRGTDGVARNGIIDLGNAGSKFNDIFATNGTIQTSDESEKQQIASLTDAEITAAKAISALFKTFKWNDSVASKGDAARTHTGVIAQQVEQALTDAGLNAGNYAFFINGTWTDDDGVEQSIKGIRYAELLSFIGAATEQRLSNIESRLAALEAN